MNATIGPWAKSFPSWSWGMEHADFLDMRPRLDQFLTPLMTLDEKALADNVSTMSQWVADHGFEHAPHGKTTMSPRLWNQLLRAGAKAITLATPWQVQFARSTGISQIMVANEIVDDVAIRWIGRELADDAFRFSCWVDSVDAVNIMRASLEDAARPLDVIIELGGTGGRAGARSVDDALRVASAVERSPELRLVGVGGYEGALADERSAAGSGRVRRYLAELIDLRDRIYWESQPIVTAGGSTWFDVVADELGGITHESTVVIRSGAYQIHDDGAYRAVTPLPRLRSAMHAWARVLSRPEPSLAILDCGKRDIPYDAGLPTCDDGDIYKINDQHCYLRSHTVDVGQVVRLGLSHPCTAMDKWRLIPVVDDAAEPNPTVVDVVATYF